ncbi:MAG TPA: hypothetical protein VHT96_03390 [Clostridia bacterium]|nr:hypothetical protein [Clostridia bacterium]
MPALFFSIAGSAAANVLQLVAGCLLAIVAYIVFKGRLDDAFNTSGLKRLSFKRVLIIVFLSITGVVLPLGIYGIIPLIAALLAAGFNSYAAGALLVSNVMFNMLVPGNDPGFIWKNGYRQLVFAFVAGLAAGLLLLIVSGRGSNAVRLGYMPQIKDDMSKPKMLALLVDDSFRKLGLLLVAGVIVDTVFQRYMLGGIVNAFYSNPVTEAIPTFFGSQNISNPLFQLTFKIIYMLMNFINLFALSAVLKPGWLVRYFVYWLVWAVILSIPAFI